MLSMPEFHLKAGEKTDLYSEFKNPVLKPFDDDESRFPGTYDPVTGKVYLGNGGYKRYIPAQE